MCVLSNVGGMKSCRLRAISYQVNQKLKRDKPLNNLLNRQFFIPRVANSYFLYSIILLVNIFLSGHFSNL